MKRLVVSLALLTACATTRQAEPPSALASAPAPATATAPAPTPPSTSWVFEGVEVFGSRKVSQEKLVELMGLPPPGTRIDKAKDNLVPQLIAGKKRLLEAYNFPYCKVSVVEYPPTHTMRVAVDVVDPGDEWRMRLNPEPQGEVADPEGLITAWQDYQKLYWKLQKQGAIPEYGVGTCRALVCHGGFDHPELASLEQRFIEGVPRHFDALVRVLREDKDGGKRYTVMLMLPYLDSREELVKTILPSVRDPDVGVRNEVLRLLGAIQEGQKRVIIPLETILEALWFPVVNDRNKAGWALVRIVETEGTVHRQLILDKAGEVLVAMAGMQQKIDHEPARKVLAILAGQDFGDDVAAWRRWLEQQRGNGAR
jgi:hypothetical protein